MQAFDHAINSQYNRMFSNYTLRPPRLSSDAYTVSVQWKLHFVAVTDANTWTQLQAIDALLIAYATSSV